MDKPATTRQRRPPRIKKSATGPMVPRIVYLKRGQKLDPATREAHRPGLTSTFESPPRKYASNPNTVLDRGLTEPPSYAAERSEVDAEPVSGVRPQSLVRAK